MGKEYVGPPENMAIRAALSVFLVGATTLALFFPMTMRWSDPETAKPVIGCFLLAFSVIWLIMLIYSIKDQDPFGIFLNGIFGAFLGLSSGLSFLMGLFAIANGVKLDFAHVDGFAHVFQAILMLVVAFVGGGLMWSLFPSFIILFVFFGGLGFIELGLLHGSNMMWLAPLLGLVGVYYTYVAIALYINASFQENKLPLGGPLFKRKD